MRKTILTISLFLILCTKANAELSSNPWAAANDNEEIQKVYEKRSRRGKANPSSQQQYTAEENTVIDRTHAYIQDTDLPEEKSTGFMDKLSNLVSAKPKTDDKLILNTQDNRRKLAEQKQQQQEEQKESASDSLLSTIGMGGLKNSLKLPSFNATNMIQKFEKASGINLKAIGKSLK